MKREIPKGYIDDQERMIGCFLGLPESEYHAVKAFSYSGWKQFKRSPLHFKAYLSKEWEVDADREKFKAVHLLCLESEAEKSRLVVKDGRWAGALKKEVIELQKSGKIVLKEKGFEDAQRIARSLKNHTIAGPVLANSLGEVSLFWVDKETGAYCKCRIDDLAFTSLGIFLGDIKNFGDLSRDQIIDAQISNNDYEVQMYFYSKGIEAVFGEKPAKRVWFFVEDDEPYGVRLKNCTDAMMEIAGKQMAGALYRYQECVQDDVWPGYPEEESDAGLSQWKWQSVL